MGRGAAGGAASPDDVASPESVGLIGGVGGETAAVCVAWTAALSVSRAGSVVGAGVGEAGGRSVATGVGKDGTVSRTAAAVASTCPATGSTSRLSLIHI